MTAPVAPGRHRSVESFRAHWRSLGEDLDCALAPRGAAGPLGASVSLFGRVVAGRFAVQPMEGWDAEENGLPSPLTLRRWRRFGRSGAPLLFGGEAFAVREDGRANPRQLFANERADVAGGLAALLAEWRAGRREAGVEGAPALAGLQLTHSGRFARPTAAFGAAPRRAVANPVLDARFRVPEGLAVLTDGELDAIGEDFVRAASLAARAGFDFVDVKCCHGYLLHELLGAKERGGRYGGSFENRTLFFRRVVAAIRAAEKGLGIAVRVSLGDVFPHAPDPATGIGAPIGFDPAIAERFGFGQGEREPRLEEGLAFLGVVRKEGIPLVNVTLGSPYTCPHVQRPAFYPPSDGYLPPEDPLAGVARHVRAARRAKAEFPDLVIVGTGYSYLQEWVAHVAEHEVGAGHVDFAGLGRSMLSYPDLPRDVLAGRALDRKRICRTFSDCTTAPRSGLRSGCYPLDPDYEALPDAAALAAAKAAARERLRR